MVASPRFGGRKPILVKFITASRDGEVGHRGGTAAVASLGGTEHDGRAWGESMAAGARFGPVVVLSTLLVVLSLPYDSRVLAQPLDSRHLQVRLIDKMQFGWTPNGLPLAYYVEIRAQGATTAISRLIIELQGLQGWHLDRSTTFTDCRGRMFVRPLYLRRIASAWDLGKVVLPAHVNQYGPVYDVPSGRRLDISRWGCETDFTLKPRFQVTSSAVKRHRFVVRVYSLQSGQPMSRASTLASLRWSGHVIHAPD